MHGKVNFTQELTTRQKLVITVTAVRTLQWEISGRLSAQC